MSGNSEKIRRLTMLAIFAAIVAVLQLLGSYIKVGPFAISLVLVPIVVGAALYGPRAGAFLGFVFSVVVAIATITGADAGAFILFSAKPLWTIILIFTKGMLAGYFAGLTFKAISKKNTYFGVIGAAIVCPVVNTGIFCAAMATIFRETLIAWAGGTPIVSYVLFVLVGVNFLIELGLNVVLSPVIMLLIRIGERGVR